jgi:hypothetical protein
MSTENDFHSSGIEPASLKLTLDGQQPKRIKTRNER